MFRFRECREMRGMTQKYVALSLGVKAPSVSDWEKGKTNPTLDNLVALSKLLGTSTDVLLGIEPDLPQDMPEGITKQEYMLISNFRNLNKQGKDYILQTMEMAARIYKSADLPDVESAGR